MEAKELNRIVTSAELRNPKVFSASRERYVAEISFKVGKTLGVAESLIPATKAIEASRKAGIMEVVEWIESQRVAGFTLIEGMGKGIPLSETKLKAQKKRWGLWQVKEA